MTDKPNQSGRSEPKDFSSGMRVVLTQDLMGPDKVVIIRRGNEDYRLRITAMGKTHFDTALLGNEAIFGIRSVVTF